MTVVARSALLKAEVFADAVDGAHFVQIRGIRHGGGVAERGRSGRPDLPEVVPSLLR